MTPQYQALVQALKRLPGLGYRSAEKVALHLIVENPKANASLVECLVQAADALGPCKTCGNLAEDELCAICASEERDSSQLCIVEGVTDLFAMERAGVFRGLYHVLHGKLAPVRGVGPDNLNLQSLKKRLEEGGINEVILALGNDMEGEATCHYLNQDIFAGLEMQITRIGFGLPSGGGVTYADEVTLRSALEGRKSLI
ncbi:recombination mediator RecR [Opitutales bacterium]|nr:recombination mediator RecR [Opitutales bacterium]